MKYIMFEKDEVRFPILFPEHVNHAAVAKIAKDIEAEIDSAGFCQFDVISAKSGGELATLGVSSIKDDATTLRHSLELHSFGIPGEEESK